MNEKSFTMLQKLPRWTDERGNTVPPGQVLSVAAKLLEALAENLEAEEHRKARAACIDAATFVKLISETSTETRIPQVPQA